MRFADVVFRRGHLSDAVLIESLTSGDRPAHLDACDLCAARATDMNRWLDDLAVAGTEAADEVFTAERLAGQQAQVMRRLAQIDQPKRVIAFPSTAARPGTLGLDARRVSPGWVGVAAAAGLVLGLIGGQLTARMGNPNRAGDFRQAAESHTTPAPGSSLFDFDLENTSLGGTPAGILDEMTPRATEVVVSSRIGG